MRKLCCNSKIAKAITSACYDLLEDNATIMWWNNKKKKALNEYEKKSLLRLAVEVETLDEEDAKRILGGIAKIDNEYCCDPDILIDGNKGFSYRGLVNFALDFGGGWTLEKSRAVKKDVMACKGIKADDVKSDLYYSDSNPKRSLLNRIEALDRDGEIIGFGDFVRPDKIKEKVNALSDEECADIIQLCKEKNETFSFNTLANLLFTDDAYGSEEIHKMAEESRAKEMAELTDYDKWMRGIPFGEHPDNSLTFSTNGEEKAEDNNIEIVEEKKEDSKEEEHYEMVNSPKHYNQYGMEVIDVIEKVFGKENTAMWCEITAFKYRMRMGLKPDNSVEQDLAKEKWYLDKAEELRRKE